MGHVRLFHIGENRILPATIKDRCALCGKLYLKAPKGEQCVRFGQWTILEECFPQLQDITLRIVPVTFVPATTPEEESNNRAILTESLRQIAAKNPHYHSFWLGSTRLGKDQWPKLISAIINWQYEIIAWREARKQIAIDAKILAEKRAQRKANPNPKPPSSKRVKPTSSKKLPVEVTEPMSGSTEVVLRYHSVVPKEEAIRQTGRNKFTPGQKKIETNTERGKK